MADLFAILPKPSTESAPFWDACNRGELTLQRCDTCATLFYYPRLFCPHCGGRETTWERLSGKATVYSYTDVFVSFYGPKWESQVPYTLVLVDLAEGPRMLSRLMPHEGRAVKIGDQVELTFAEVEGQKLPYFALV